MEPINLSLKKIWKRITNLPREAAEIPMLECPMCGKPYVYPKAYDNHIDAHFKIRRNERAIERTQK